MTDPQRPAVRADTCACRNSQVRRYAPGNRRGSAPVNEDETAEMVDTGHGWLVRAVGATGGVLMDRWDAATTRARDRLPHAADN